MLIDERKANQADGFSWGCRAEGGREMGREDALHGGELGVPPEWDTDTTSAEERPIVLHFEDGCMVVPVVELRAATG